VYRAAPAGNRRGHIGRGEDEKEEIIMKRILAVLLAMMLIVAAIPAISVA
jgi:hypothetical protein